MYYLKGIYNMKETILLFNANNKAVNLKIQKALFPLKIRLKKVDKTAYNQPLGYLAGIDKIAPLEEADNGAELEDMMIIFAFLSDARLNQVLAALRKCGAGPFPYKAILTPTNQFWNARQCFDEVKKEHEAMH